MSESVFTRTDGEQTTSPVMRAEQVGIHIYAGGGKYGPNVHKVSHKAVRHLVPLGWTVVHRGMSYSYMRAAEPRRGKIQMVTVMVPDTAAILAFTDERHRIGTQWRGTVFGWPAAYDPFRAAHVEESKQTELTGTGVVSRTVLEERPARPPRFSIGELCIWYREFTMPHDQWVEVTI